MDLLLKGKGVHSPELIMRMRMKRPRKTIKIKAGNLTSTQRIHITATLKGINFKNRI